MKPLLSLAGLLLIAAQPAAATENFNAFLESQRAEHPVKTRRFEVVVDMELLNLCDSSEESQAHQTANLYIVGVTPEMRKGMTPIVMNMSGPALKEYLEEEGGCAGLKSKYAIK